MYFTLYQDKMIKNKYGIDEPIDKQEINKELLICIYTFRRFGRNRDHIVKSSFLSNKVR